MRYNIFYDQGDHLKGLVKSGSLDEAADLFAKYKIEFFEKNSSLTGKNRLKQYSSDLKKIAFYLNSTVYEPKLKTQSVYFDSYLDWPVIQSDWGKLEKELRLSKKQVEKYKSHPLLGMSEYTAQVVNELDNKIKAVEIAAKESARGAFLLYGIANGGDFFLDYPVDLNEKEVINLSFSEILSELLSSGQVEEVENFVDSYGEFLTSDFNEKIGGLYLSKFIKENEDAATPYLSTLMAGLVRAKELGLNPSSSGDVKIAFVEVTSKTLLAEGQVEFPASINMDLPFDIKKSEVGDIFADNEDADYIIIFDVAMATVNRRIKERNQAKSTYLFGYNTVQNPDFLARNMDVQNARMSLQNVSGRLCYGQGALGCEIAKLISVGVASAELKKHQEVLLETPQTLKEPIHKGYEYSTSSVDVKKHLTANYYVINNKDRAYYKSTFDVSENRKFNLSYDVKDEDISKPSLTKKYDPEESVSDYEERAVDIDVSLLLSHYLENIGEEERLDSEDEFRLSLLYDKNQALVAYKERTYDARPLNDHRFDHVVVIYNPTGSIGAGFYVAPDLVLTNYHVIEGGKYAEMKLYNGHETFGKVVKSDVRLDLALIKVQEKGKPVQFYDENSLDLGATTEAIGHPKGLEFTVTRGVISAIRKKESIFDTGGKEVLFVQTDTAINPGNSGGPLFLDNMVIGVNDNKLVDIGTEGLGFAIHHSEIQEFLKEDF
ncbi:MAG: trypsin-like serine protease [Candidatus Marinimicrobia bacterium]|nr:trypsin-like serine protease [Gammaproteobacteria bacterium]MBT4131469.1 trypsin-like serine protease [Candidatus Neomarinimicrobiota bacterium]MBT5267991.1 trypsin-like serine protease [Candidatus Neomarinimicrobiota bacterium]MBT7327549.1 trypsin-like serine protease [Gammaproteobacteria bacterium]